MWKRGHIKGILLLTGVLSTLHLAAQGPEFSMTDTTVTTCYGQLYDSGGADELYSNNEDLVFTIDAGVPLLCEWVDFFEVEEPLGGNWFDYVVLYAGPSTASPVIDTLAGEGVLPPSFSTAGALTLKFHSDGSAQRPGFHLIWEADIDPPQAPSAVWNAPGSCPHSVFQLVFNQPIECALVDWDTVELTGFAANLATVQNISCAGGSTSMLMFPVDGDGFDVNCPIEILVQIGVRDECDSIWTYPVNAVLQIDDCGPNLDWAMWTDTVCAGSCAWQEVTTAGCLATDVLWTGSDGSSFAGPGPHQLCPESTTDYTISAVVAATGLSEQLVATLAVVAAETGVQDTSMCMGEALLLTGSPPGGTWSGPGVYMDPNDSSAFSFFADSAGIGVHLIDYLLPGLGCSAQWQVDVLDFSVPSALAACPGSGAFQIPATPSDGSWAGTDVDSSGLFAPVTPGTFVLVYTAGYCTGSTVVVVDDIAVVSDLGQICATEPADSLPTWPPGGLWTGPGIMDQANAWFDPAEVAAGPFILTYSIEGCSQQVPGEILPIWGGWNRSSCPTQDPWIPNPGAVPAGGTWSGPGISDPATGEFDPSAVGDDSWSLLLYTAENGCIDTTWMLTRTTRIIPTTADLCLGAADIDLNSDAIGASPWCGIWTVQVADPGGAGAVVPGAVENVVDCDWMFYPSVLSSGGYQLYYTRNGCVDSVEISVFPDELALDALLLCQSSPAFDLAADAGAWSGTWSGLGVDAAGWFDPELAAALSGAVGGGDGTTGALPIAWNNPAACRDTVWIEVELLPELSAAGLVGVLCWNEDALEVEVAPAEAVLTIDGAGAGDPLTTAGLGEGAHTVALNWNGAVCAADSAWTFEVLPPLTAELSVTDSTLCPGSATVLQVSYAGGLTAPNGPTAANISWWDGAPPYDERPAAPEVSQWATVEIADGCSDPAIDSVYLLVLPPFDVAVDASELSCYGTPGAAELIVSSPASVAMFWDGDPLESNFGTGIAGDSYVWALIDAVEGCSWDTLIELPGHPPVTAAFTVVPDETCIAWTSQPLQFIDLSQYADSGWWQIQTAPSSGGAGGTGGSGGTEGALLPYVFGQNLNWSFAEPGTYEVQLSVVHSSGCADTASQSVCILPDITLWFPEAFSPNDDGANDRFSVHGEGLLDYACRIYNRWGALVWSSEDVADSWDGFSMDGHKAPQGVYVVQISARDTGGLVTSKTAPLRLVR